MRKPPRLSWRNARRSSRAPNALETTQLGKGYGSVNALSALDLTIPRGLVYGGPRHTGPRQFRLPDETDAMGVRLAAPGAIAMMFWTALLAFGVVMAFRGPDLSDRSTSDAGRFVHPV
jgi:hypothetical protein